MLTINTLLSNISKGQSGIPMRIIFQQLENVYKKISSKIRMQKAEFQDGGTLIYLKIPSEDLTTKKFYDVDFWFKSVKRLTQNVEFKVYSNSAKFGYTYAYLFNKEGSLLFPEKYPKIMLTQPPNVRNPYAAIGFDKHVYAGLKFLIKKDLSNLVASSNPKTVVDVLDFETKMKEVAKRSKKTYKK